MVRRFCLPVELITLRRGYSLCKQFRRVDVSSVCQQPSLQCGLFMPPCYQSSRKETNEVCGHLQRLDSRKQHGIRLSAAVLYIAVQPVVKDRPPQRPPLF